MPTVPDPERAARGGCEAGLTHEALQYSSVVAVCKKCVRVTWTHVWSELKNRKFGTSIELERSM